MSVLQDYIKMMPIELPKWLPTGHKMDHIIELVLNAKPLMMTPYWMTLVKLREL